VLRPATTLRLKKSALVGLVIGAWGAFLVLPGIGIGLDLEENIGLHWLFHMRGPVEPPAGVLVIDTGMEAAYRLSGDAEAVNRWPCLKNLEQYERDAWPRCLHGGLVDTLNRRGVAAVVFDIAFEDEPSWTDDLRAVMQAARHKNVVLLQTYTVRNEEMTPGRVSEKLMDVARGFGPWLLPTDPSRRVDRYWTFKPELDNAPTLPVVALQVCADPLLGTFLNALHRARPDQFEQSKISSDESITSAVLVDQMKQIRAGIKAVPGTAERVLQEVQAELGAKESPERRCLTALIKTYGGRTGYFANFYGPIGSIPTIAGDDLLREEAAQTVRGPQPTFEGAVAFLGVSGTSMSGPPDAHYTVFSRADGADLTGVEIAATAFANLLTDRPIRQLSNFQAFLCLLGFGAAAGALAVGLPGLRGVAAVVALAGAYYAVAQLQFDAGAVWMFVFVPLAVQAPLAALMASVMHYLEARRERENVERAMEFYVPKGIVEAAARSGRISENAVEVYGVCLTTDAKDFTTVSQRITPRNLAALLNRYFGLLSEPVQRNGGEVSNIVADRMMCLWCGAPSERRMRLNACLAALEIREIADSFSRQQGHEALPTRIGINAGELVLANVGGGGRYAYSLVGIIPNGAERIEGLNKILRTRLLASAEVVKDLDELIHRRIGLFIPPGMLTSLTIHEIISLRDAPADGWPMRCAQYEEAMGVFEAGRWAEAAALFEALRAAWPTDGPAAFFHDVSRLYATTPPTHETPWVIRVDTK